MLEGSHLRGVMPKNQSRLWLRRCHRRQHPHTGVSVRLEPLAFPYQHEPPPKNLAQSPTSPTHQHRHRQPPSAFDPTTAAQPSRREPLFMPLKRPCRRDRGTARSGGHLPFLILTRRRHGWRLFVGPVQVILADILAGQAERGLMPIGRSLSAGFKVGMRESTQPGENVDWR